jgi:hypothetical protein
MNLVASKVFIQKIDRLSFTLTLFQISVSRISESAVGARSQFIILNEKCLSVSPNFVTLSAVPLRLRFLERARWEKKNDTKIMGVPPLEKIKNSIFHFCLFNLGIWSKMKARCTPCWLLWKNRLTDRMKKTNCRIVERGLTNNF